MDYFSSSRKAGAQGSISFISRPNRNAKSTSFLLIKGGKVCCKIKDEKEVQQGKT